MRVSSFRSLGSGPETNLPLQSFASDPVNTAFIWGLSILAPSIMLREPPTLQYLTSISLVTVILLRSGITLFVRLLFGGLHERVPATTICTHAAENIRDRRLSSVVESCELNAHNGEFRATQPHEESYA